MFISLLLSAVLAAQPAGADLRAVLCSGTASPLDRLSAGGRVRLLQHLKETPGGRMTIYPPLIVDLTEEERLEVVRHLGLDAYLGGPKSVRSQSADHRSPPLPAPDSTYCQAEASLEDWAVSWRRKNEGSLSVALMKFEGDVKAIPSAAGADERRRLTEKAASALPLASLTEAALSAPPWVVRDLGTTLAFHAELSESPLLIGAGLEAAESLEARSLDERSDAGGLRALKARMAEPETAAFLVWDAEGNGAVPGALEGPAVVMVGTPFCGFCRMAADAIEDDPETLRLMTEHGILLAPPNEALDSRAQENWRRAHPALPYAVATSRTAWPNLSFMSTPTFYLVEGSRAELLFTGWPRQGSGAQLQLLRSALEEIAKRSGD